MGKTTPALTVRSVTIAGQAGESLLGRRQSVACGMYVCMCFFLFLRIFVSMGINREYFENVANFDGVREVKWLFGTLNPDSNDNLCESATLHSTIVRRKS